MTSHANNMTSNKTLPIRDCTKEFSPIPAIEPKSDTISRMRRDGKTQKDKGKQRHEKPVETKPTKKK